MTLTIMKSEDTNVTIPTTQSKNVNILFLIFMVQTFRKFTGFTSN